MPFGIGAPELILIMVVALIVFGPRRLPELGSSLGNAMREFRRATSDLSRDLTAAEPSRPAIASSVPDVASASNTMKEGEGRSVCQKCGTDNPNGNKFCGHCGATLGEQAP